MGRILFAGFGDLGQRAAAELVRGGHRIIALKRTALSAAPAGVECRALDLRAPFELERALSVDVAVIAVTSQRGDRDDYAATYLGATQNLIRALEATGALPKRVFFVSSTSVWPDSNRDRVTEDTPAVPAGWNGQIQRQAEELLFASSLPATALRLAGIYGPGRDRMIRKVEAMAAGEEPVPPAAYTNRIHCEDAARLLAALVERALTGQALAPIYTGVDDEPALNRDVFRFIAARLGARLVLPESDGSEVGGKRLGNDRVHALGFSFRFPTFREGYESQVRAYLEGAQPYTRP